MPMNLYCISSINMHCYICSLQNMRSSRSLASLFTEPPENVLGLNTIASSPLDSTLPSTEPDLPDLPARPRKVLLSNTVLYNFYLQHPKLSLLLVFMQ